jgi:hypothetical protein
VREDGDGRGQAPEAPEVQYFALLRDGGTAQDASGLIRRTHTRPIPTDEAIGNDFAWHPTEYLRLYRLGHNDTDHVEITAEAAQALLGRWRATWAARSTDPPQTSGP